MYQNRRASAMSSTISVLVLISFLLNHIPYTPILSDYCNQIIDVVIVYFGLHLVHKLLFKSLGPTWLCVIGAVILGWATEYLQYKGITLFNFFPVGYYDPLDLVFFVVGGLLALKIDYLIQTHYMRRS